MNIHLVITPFPHAENFDIDASKTALRLTSPGSLRALCRKLAMAPVTPAWVERMNLRRWYAISGDHPDLELQPTAPATRYLADNDPARDPVLLQVAVPVEAFDTPELHELLTDMRERRWRR